jgi:hypothetical protein
MKQLRLFLRRRPRLPRGYALPFVIVMLILVAVAMTSMLFVLAAGARSTESMLGRRKAFYVCDGLGRLVTIAAADYFKGLTGNPSSTALKDHVTALGGGPTLPTFLAQTPGYVLQTLPDSSFDFDIQPIGTRVLEPLSSGPFEGMLAAQDGVSLRIGAVRASSGWLCRQQQTVTLGKIAMFQFFVFSDQPYTDWTPGPEMAATGRVHANGTLCIGSNSGPLWVDRATAHGNIVHAATATCPGCKGDFGGCLEGTGGDGSRAVKVAFVDAGDLDGDGLPDKPRFDTTPADSDPIQPDPADFRDFGSASRTSSWASFALSQYGGHLLDAAHSVPELRLPVLGNVNVQKGYDASADSPPPVTNPTTRILVDPVLTGDALDVKQQKLAYQADLRIINGVWYLRDIANPDAWPGIPIWSDHPGSYTTVGEEGVEPAGVAVGQDQIETARAGTTGAWGTVRPKRFSPYRFNTAGDLTTAATDPPAVLSYGVLARDGGSGSALWSPGVRCKGDENDAAVRPARSTTLACDEAARGSSPDSVAERLLRGSRTGFRNAFIDKFERNRSGGNRERANVVPLNFDVAAFQQALASNEAGELGRIFSGSRKFNGIVWISSTWDGSMDPAATLPPPQGSVDDTNQPEVIKQKEDDDPLKPDKNLENRALPYPLCAGATSSIVGRAIRDAADGNKATGNTADVNDGFKIPSCANYVGTGAQRNARPTALRIYNARNVNNVADPRPDLAGAIDRLPEGLTIATNLPVYILGDVNLGSDPKNLAASSPWVPVLVAGDIVHVLSNAWNDTKARWSKTPNGSDDADKTTLRVQILAGWTPTTNTSGRFSGGLHNFPRFVEDWDNVVLEIRGSLVVGWAAVYNQAPWSLGSVYDAPERDWGFDRHLEKIVNQPPGAPLFDVAAVRQWSR